MAGAAAAKVKAEADAAAAMAGAAAAKVKAEADAAAAMADAAAAKAKAEADAESAAKEEREAGAWRLLFLRSAVGLVVAAAGLYLAWDELTHSKPWIRWRIRQTLKAGTDEALLPQLPRVSLGVAPITEECSAVLVMGHSGSGKTTALGKMARELKQRGVPFVFIRLRSAHDWRQPVADAAESSGVDLSNAAIRFYRAIGYPEEPSWLSGWRLGSPMVSSVGVSISAVREAQVSRFKDAIRELFDVAANLRVERLKDSEIKPENVTPVIIADELHELLSEVALPAGGKQIFSQFGVEMATHCPDNHVRVFVAASGGYLVDDLDAVAKITDPRAAEFFSSDPTPSAVRERLKEVGFSESDVDAIVGTCGTRLRHLMPFLTATRDAGGMMRHENNVPLDVGQMLERKLAAAAQQLDQLFCRSADAHERAALAQLLDDLARCEGASVRRSDLVMRHLSAITTPFPNKVLHLGSGGTVELQAEPVRKAWMRGRKNFVA
jgi:GTPase SAR1 family protein